MTASDQSFIPSGDTINTHAILTPKSLVSSSQREVQYELPQEVPRSDSSYSTTPTTSLTSVSSQHSIETFASDLKQYVALGCLRLEEKLRLDVDCGNRSQDWLELNFARLPDEMKSVIGDEASRLLEASWIRMFVHQRIEDLSSTCGSLIRIYLLPEDWGRKYVDRRSKSLKMALRQLLSCIDISSKTWLGDPSNGEIKHFDPWPSAQDYSLFYLFNKLPSPAPSPERIKDRYSRNAAWGLLDSYKMYSSDRPEDAHIPGLKTRLYRYQSRSAALMLEREAAPRLQLDPRLETRTSPNGEEFFFGARDGSFLKQPVHYESNRGGILAETMGLGKTIISLALILATKGHMPHIPPAYQPQPPIREKTGSLSDMAASTIGRHAIPGRVYLDQVETSDSIRLEACREALAKNLPYYEIPVEPPRMNRNTKIPPPRTLLPTSGTIIVVPRNLLHQWQTEIRKHVFKDSLRILVMETVTKRSVKARPPDAEGSVMDLKHELPAVSALMEYDVILFSRNRFEQEIQDGADSIGRRMATGAPLKCECSYIGSSRIRDCHCVNSTGIYESPLKKLHWLRIIIDEGHSFSSGSSNAVLVAKQLQAERRWVVSGTPAKNLVGVEMDLSTLSQSDNDPAIQRELVIEQRKAFSKDDEEDNKAAKALGLLAANFLMVRPWSEPSSEGKLEWDEYIYRHEAISRKTYSSFSACFRNTLEGLVVKTRPDDVEKDIKLPPMIHRTVYLRPSWFDKMTANLFIQVLRANAITSERSDVDYLFHKNSVQARHSLIRHLRQSMFTWTGFTLEDVKMTLETTDKYLSKEDKRCTTEDILSLKESSTITAQLLNSDAWIALSKSHEIGVAVTDWPKESEKFFSLAYPKQPAMVGITQLLAGQAHVDRQILGENPENGLTTVGQVVSAQLLAIEEVENKFKRQKSLEKADSQGQKQGVPSSCVGGQPVTSRRVSAAVPLLSSPKKSRSSKLHSKTEGYMPETEGTDSVERKHIDLSNPNGNGDTPSASITHDRPKKRRLTLADEEAELPVASALRKTQVIGTVSAKLTYLIDKIMKHQATEKILIFYDGDNAAYYLAQCLEMLYVNHRIYARTLDNILRAQYVAKFNEDSSLRVLLIDVACGALGLNLNAASVVLIVNPINRPGIEAQAIKRAHRIGQVKEVLVETLILEGTIEEKIFKHAKTMSRTEHMEAKELEDNNGIVDIIQNAEVLHIDPGECNGSSQFALLDTPQQVFGRPGREKYHRVGQADAKSSAKEKDKTRKRARTGASAFKRNPKREIGKDIAGVDINSALPLPALLP